MPDIDGRVIRLEERSEAHQRTMDHLLTEIGALRREMSALGSALRGEMSALRGEMSALRSELRGDMAAFRTEVRQELGELRGSMDRRFTWLVGLQVATLLAIVGAVAGAFYR